MIVKGSRRCSTGADARELLTHLLHGAGNEAVVEVCGLGSTGRLIDDARALVAGTGQAAVWHLSLSPELPLTGSQWSRAEQVIRSAYGIYDDVPGVAVEHTKPHRPGRRDGRPPRPSHRHLIFPSCHPVTGRVVNPFRHYVINERVARQLEHEFGHPLVKGRHNTAVARWLAENGQVAVANAMRTSGLLDGGPGVQAVSDGERRAADRRGADPFAAVDALEASLALASGLSPERWGRAFCRAMATRGFLLARGNHLVLLPKDGGCPIQAARKARMTEDGLRTLLGDTWDRLPVIGTRAKGIRWEMSSHDHGVTARRHPMVAGFRGDGGAPCGGDIEIVSAPLVPKAEADMPSATSGAVTPEDRWPALAHLPEEDCEGEEVPDTSGTPPDGKLTW